MKYGVAFGLSLAMLALANAQEISSSTQEDAPLIGLRVGQRAPAFASRDQFGHGQSNETLRDRTARFFYFSVLPIGDPSVKRSSCSCKMPKKDLRNRESN